MLLLEGLLVGLFVGFLTGGSLSRLQVARLNHERVFLCALLALLVWPPLAGGLGVGQREFIVAWLLIALLLIGLALLNMRYLGMALAAFGLIANFVVVSLNGAMPVELERVDSDKARVAQRVADSLLHEKLVEGTMTPWLGDVILVPGPRWHAALVSWGDLLLVFGTGAVVAQMMHTEDVNALDS